MFEKGERVKLAIVDPDLKARVLKKFRITEGGRIDVVSSGKGYFAPKFDNDRYIEFPRRSFVPPFKTRYERIYIAIRGADACIDFKTPHVPGPDPKQVIETAQAEIIRNFGKQKQETAIWTFVQVGLLVFIVLKLLGVIA